jgi:hypothetical protein
MSGGVSVAERRIAYESFGKIAELALLLNRDHRGLTLHCNTSEVVLQSHSTTPPWLFLIAESTCEVGGVHWYCFILISN